MPNIINYDKKEVIIPSDWNELTKKQYLFVCEKFADIITSPDKLTTEEYYASKVFLVRHFLQMSWSKFQHVTAEQIACILPYLEFLDSKEITLNKNLVPSFRCFGIKYYGPKDRMKTSTMGELVSADTYFINSQKKSNPEMLYMLLATIYRPKQRFIWIKKYLGTWDGDMRQKFNSRSTENRSKFFKRFLHKKYCWAALYFYWGFRKHNVMAFRSLFAQPDEDGETDVREKSGNDYGWAGTLLEMAGDKFGDFKATENTNWFTLFVEMSRQMEESKKREMQKP